MHLFSCFEWTGTQKICEEGDLEWIDKTGINVSYVVALAIVYILFTAFVITVVKRGRKRRAEQDAQQ